MNVLIDKLQKVLDRAHSQHVYVRDKKQYGLSEFWTKNLVGDCEDFALWVRDELHAIGVDCDLMFCQTETGEYHLCCSVEGYILDNRYKFVMLNQDLNYKWHSLGRPDGKWYSVVGVEPHG